MLTVESRFWAKVEKTEGCWLWTAGLWRGGYGQFTVRHDVKVSAHRWAYEATIGPIPDGLVLDHLCRVRNCVNPEHLEPVEHAENVRRGESWKISADKTHCRAGHEYAGENLYVRPSDGARICRTCTRLHVSAYRTRKRAADSIAV